MKSCLRQIAGNLALSKMYEEPLARRAFVGDRMYMEGNKPYDTTYVKRIHGGEHMGI